MSRGAKKYPLEKKRTWLTLAREVNYSATAMAKICGITVRQLERHAQTTLGCTPQQWLDQQRMVMAQALLREADTIKEVSFQLGFKQPSHFCRQFKLYFGMTPTEFVAMCRSQER